MGQADAYIGCVQQNFFSFSFFFFDKRETKLTDFVIEVSIILYSCWCFLRRLQHPGNHECNCALTSTKPSVLSASNALAWQHDSTHGSTRLVARLGKCRLWHWWRSTVENACAERYLLETGVHCTLQQSKCRIQFLFSFFFVTDKRHESIVS